jgi:hypothetical protein
MPGINSAFAIWAAVVGMIGAAIVWQLSRLRLEVNAMTVKLNDYILSMERRVTHIETHMGIKHDDFRPLVIE